MSKSRSKYEQVYDGEWFDLPKDWQLACCDCGVTHRVFVRRKNGKVQIRMDRDGPATGGMRAAGARKA